MAGTSWANVEHNVLVAEAAAASATNYATVEIVQMSTSSEGKKHMSIEGAKKVYSLAMRLQIIETGFGVDEWHQLTLGIYEKVE